MGAPISSHYGAICCPALKKDTDDRYIVKIISVPASRKQLDALLLTGAYSNPDDAAAYFKDQADGICAEAETLRELSAGAGFVPYDGWQVVPKEDNQPGCRIYLLGPYRRSLDKQLRKGLITHQDALKLGQELCSALSACREAGFLYVALKPSNIFLSEDQGYRVGDLGFIKMDSLEFTPLPGKYRSAYSPPETQDAMHTLDGTVDTYALGMILYQLCNHGHLPAPADSAERAISPPAEAGEALSRIILKAISPDFLPGGGPGQRRAGCSRKRNSGFFHRLCKCRADCFRSFPALRFFLRHPGHPNPGGNRKKPACFTGNPGTANRLRRSRKESPCSSLWEGNNCR